MKRCPTCNRSYADNTLSFCLEYGAHLEPDRDPVATVVAQPRPPAPPVGKPRRTKQTVFSSLSIRPAGLLEVVTEVALSNNKTHCEDHMPGRRNSL